MFCVTPNKARKRGISFKGRCVEDQPNLHYLLLLVPKTLPIGTKLIFFIKRNHIKCMSFCGGGMRRNQNINNTFWCKVVSLSSLLSHVEHPEDYGSFEDRDDGLSNREHLQMVGDLCGDGQLFFMHLKYQVPLRTDNQISVILLAA